MSSKFAGLTNEQIVFIYLKLRKYTDYVRAIEESGYITRSIDIGSATINFKKKVDQDDLDFIKSIPLVGYYLSIEETLGPIVEIIKDADYELYSNIEKIINEVGSNIDDSLFASEEDDDEEEDNND